jgi:threonine/homoserine/homoserine lactone efflux protein
MLLKSRFLSIVGALILKRGGLVDFIFLLRGLIVGFSIAAPVGPIGVLCIRRTLSDGRASGLASGLGAATADGLYGCIAGFGLSLLSNFLISQQIWLHLLGGMFLIYLGTKTLLTKPATQAASTAGKGMVGAYLSTLFLTLTNPMTILSFAAIFAGLGLASGRGDDGTAIWLVLGVFLGSALWWLTLTSVVGAFRERFDAHRMRWVNRISGAVILGFGLLALANSLRGFG